jgi:hypothetical protein
MILERLREMDIHWIWKRSPLWRRRVINRPISRKRWLSGVTSKPARKLLPFHRSGSPAYFLKKFIALKRPCCKSIKRAAWRFWLIRPAPHGNITNTLAEIHRLQSTASFDGVEAYHGDCICDHARLYVKSPKNSIFSSQGDLFHGDEKHQPWVKPLSFTNTLLFHRSNEESYSDRISKKGN